MIVYLLLIVLSGLIGLHVWTRYRRMGRLVEKLPGYKPLPFLGTMLRLMGSREHLWNTLRQISKEFPIARIWFFTNVWVTLSNADDIQVALTNKTNLNRKALYEYSIPWLKSGILTSNGEKWFHRRRIVNTGFHVVIMKKYTEIMGEHTKKLVAKLKSHGDESIENITQIIPDLTLNIICEAALGVNLDNVDAILVQKYKAAFRDLYHIFTYRSVRPYIRNWMMRFLPIGRKQDRGIKVVEEFIDKVLGERLTSLIDFRGKQMLNPKEVKIIQERREYNNRVKSLSYQDFVNDVDSTSSDAFEGRRKRLVMLDVLLSAEKDGLIDAEGIREEVDILTVAGHDTTASLLVFMLMLFAENPEIQDRARREVIEIFSKNGGNLDVAESQKFEYLDRCFKETLRLFPPIPQFARHLDEDMQLKKYLIPAGVDILVLVYDLHRDPNIWPEPNKFDPDRFLPENVKNRHPYAYIPFSAGLRNCIAKKFAMIEAKITMAHILYNFCLEPVDRIDNMKFETNVTLLPCRPVNVKFIKRNEN